MNVLTFAQQVDRSGQRFYEVMAERAGHPGISHIFTLLASDERGLLNRMQELRENRSDYRKYDSAALNDSVNVFDRLLHQEHLDFKDDVEAYQLALDAEREVVREYEQAIARESQPEVRKLLNAIAGAERHELDELEKLYNFVNAPNEYLEWGEFSNLGEFHNFGRDVDQ